jgi:hypothetical protein
VSALYFFQGIILCIINPITLFYNDTPSSIYNNNNNNNKANGKWLVKIIVNWMVICRCINIIMNLFRKLASVNDN